jgi:hypothetical protein
MMFFELNIISDNILKENSSFHTQTTNLWKRWVTPTQKNMKRLQAALLEHYFDIPIQERRNHARLPSSNSEAISSTYPD